MNISQQIARDLLSIKAVSLSPQEPYTWASGLRSPIYCDNRLTISYPEIRTHITEAFVTYIKKSYPEVDAIVGTATAGIPQACWVSDKLNLPMAYVRASSKEHGKNNQVEGALKPGSKVVVIEDLISTGKSSILAANVLKEAGHEVLSVLAIFSYEMTKANQNFEHENLKYHSLSGFSIMLKEALSLKSITDEDYELLKNWSHDPQAFSDKFE